MKSYIVINFEFPALHCWPGCPFEEVSFLRDSHRHLFKVTVRAEVGHDDREIEFIMFKKKIEEFIREQYYDKDLGKRSCEMICKELLNYFPLLCYAKVMEDGENGGEVWM